MQANQFVNIREHPRNEEGVQMLRADDVRLIETTNLGYLSFGSIIHCFLKSSDSSSLRLAKSRPDSIGHFNARKNMQRSPLK